MTTERLRVLFEPRQDRFMPVHPKRAEAVGRPAFRSPREIGEPVDAAFGG